ncbi:hypothetical protein [Mesorhizobium sp. J8]|uniref:hypothetical protein n=1 Tax=Mesorhizobium sp. J8 TaxID=2777475 RepID=UPI00191555D6|nr:hypothetical protein [Mesorhizobium sp. J8]BCM20903.1 hypothetical protein MJ8_46940 [Mesorhizobium sp. J8]
MVAVLRASMRGIVTTIGAGMSRSSVGAKGALRKLVRDLFDPYRPELYYMRGPGPRSHEKNGGLHIG